MWILQNYTLRHAVGMTTEYLGVIISEGSIWMDPVRIAGIAEWPHAHQKSAVAIVLRLYQLL